MVVCTSSTDYNYQEHPLAPLTELRSCVKVEVDVLGSPSLKVLMVSVDIKSELRSCVKVEVDVLDVPESPYVLCRRKATLN